MFVDNFAIFTSQDEHLDYLRKTFEKCQGKKLRPYPRKSFLGVNVGELLGHVMSLERIRVNLERIVVILMLVAPTIVTRVEGFLRCVGYYKRFISHYTQIALPLINLLRKLEPFEWTKKRQWAVDELKKQLDTTPILAPPNWNKEFHVTIYSSGFYLGAILWRYNEEKNEHSIYFVSKKMSALERNSNH